MWQRLPRKGRRGSGRWRRGRATPCRWEQSLLVVCLLRVGLGLRGRRQQDRSDESKGSKTGVSNVGVIGGERKPRAGVRRW